MKFRIEYKDITTYSGIVEAKDKKEAKKRIRENPFNQKDTYHTQLNNAGFNFPEWSKTNHYGEDGHAWWAERLISYIANP